MNPALKHIKRITLSKRYEKWFEEIEEKPKLESFKELMAISNEEVEFVNEYA